MVLALTLGTLTTIAVVAAAVANLYAPTRLRCPNCGARTMAVLPKRWMGMSARWVRFRWCPACSWEGVGRNGPEWIPGRPMSHPSGFHWGIDETDPHLGFRWGSDDEPRTPRAPPDHPSGFRFGERNPTDWIPHPAHPSGFTWASRLGRRPESFLNRHPSHPSGFEWGEVGDAPVFLWKEDASERDSA